MVTPNMLDDLVILVHVPDDVNNFTQSHVHSLLYLTFTVLSTNWIRVAVAGIVFAKFLD